MNMATITLAVLAALGFFAAGPAMAQSSADQPASGTAGGMTQSGPATSDVSNEDLREYARVWVLIVGNPSDQELATALQSGGDLSAQEQDLSTALTTANSPMTVEQFEQVHRQVQRDPNLQARMQQEAAASRSGGAGSTSGSQTSRPGEGAPLPSGALGTGPAVIQGGTPEGGKQPGVGAGAPVVSGSEGDKGSDGGTK